MEVISAAGIGFTLARTWQGTRALERQLKNRHNSGRLCPICRAEQRAAPRPNRRRRPQRNGAELAGQTVNPGQQRGTAGCPSR
jgi:hypothetical protein